MGGLPGRRRGDRPRGIEQPMSGERRGRRRRSRHWAFRREELSACQQGARPALQQSAGM